MLLSLAVCLIFAVSNVIAANILFLFPIPSPSHQVMTKELTKALIAKGHRITMVSPYPLETTTDNYTDVFIDGMFKFREGEKSSTDKQIILLVFDSREIEECNELQCHI